MDILQIRARRPGCAGGSLERTNGTGAAKPDGAVGVESPIRPFDPATKDSGVARVA